MKASEIGELSRLPTGLSELDALLGGGIVMRRIAQFSGRYSCGKSTLAALVVAEAQRQGHATCWLDVENRFNPPYYAGLGIDLSKLEYESGKVAEDYFKIVHEWVEKKGGVIVLDSVAALLTRNESEKEDGPSVPEVPKMIPNFLKKVTNELGAAKKEGALIVLNHEKQDFNGALKVIGGRSVEHFVTQWVRLRKLTAPTEVPKKSGKQYADAIEASMKKDANQFALCKLLLVPGEGFKNVEVVKRGRPKSIVE